jgi:hypothetical protein
MQDKREVLPSSTHSEEENIQTFPIAGAKE